VMDIEYLDRVFLDSIKQFVWIVYERDRVNIRAIRHLWRALRPLLDAVHDRA
jgi:hypothetical protein